MAHLARSATHRKAGGSNPPRGITFWLGFPDGSDGEEPACNAGDPGSIPGSGRSPGKGNDNLFQYSCLEKITWTEEPGRLQS